MLNRQVKNAGYNNGAHPFKIHPQCNHYGNDRRRNNCLTQLVGHYAEIDPRRDDIFR